MGKGDLHLNQNETLKKNLRICILEKPKGLNSSNVNFIISWVLYLSYFRVSKELPHS